VKETFVVFNRTFRMGDVIVSDVLPLTEIYREGKGWFQRVGRERSGRNRVDLMNEAMEVVDPITKVFFVMDHVIVRLRGSSRESIWTMVSSCNVD
jgi:hypothetical protein